LEEEKMNHKMISRMMIMRRKRRRRRMIYFKWRVEAAQTVWGRVDAIGLPSSYSYRVLMLLLLLLLWTEEPSGA
jgi:hypothetical protein